jgi:hypothetical protein
LFFLAALGFGLGITLSQVLDRRNELGFFVHYWRGYEGIFRGLGRAAQIAGGRRSWYFSKLFRVVFACQFEKV